MPKLALGWAFHLQIFRTTAAHVGLRPIPQRKIETYPHGGKGASSFSERNVRDL